MKVWLNNNYWYYLSKINLYLIHIGIVWPHSLEALAEVRASDHMIGVKNEEYL